MFVFFKKYIDNNHKVYCICGIKFKFHISIYEEFLCFKNEQKNIVNNLKAIIKNKVSKSDAIKIASYLRPVQLSNEIKIRHLSQKFYTNIGYYPNFKYPKTFNEKIGWLRFNYKNPLADKIEDKIFFKQYIEQQLGSQYVIKLLALFDDVADLNFDGLPDKFVIKTSFGFGSNGVKVINNKNKVNLDKIKFDLSKVLNPSEYSLKYGLFRDEDPKQKIFIEEYIEEIDKNSCDYKFFCFHGEPKFFYVANSWATNTNKMTTYYDMNLNLMPLKYGNHKGANTSKLNKSNNFDKMVEIAKKLSKDFPIVRVDLYDVKDKIYAGELTFSPGSGLGKYDPVDWDYKFGDWLDLKRINPEYLMIAPEFKDEAKKFIDSVVVDTH